MSIRTQVKPYPACQSAVAALKDDPFYRTICVTDKGYGVSYNATLVQYFAYSIQEGSEIGRSVHPPDDPAAGVAVWLLPQIPNITERARHNKKAFLKATLGTEGYANYFQIVEFMRAKAATLVDKDAWYLSIVAIDPAAQGRGLGSKLLQPTIAEADHASATCYVETFNPRSISFYQRLGFAIKAQFTEPTSAAEYTVMVRRPRRSDKPFEGDRKTDTLFINRKGGVVAEDMYSRIISLLDGFGASYQLIDHPPEGKTEVVSSMRGHDPRDAAKCMIVMVKLGRKTTKYILAVIPGDRRLSLGALKALFGATYVSFASTEIAERLAGSPTGTILPFVVNPELELIVDPSLQKLNIIYFNAARLDRSIALNTSDYLAIAKPRFASIAEPASTVI